MESLVMNTDALELQAEQFIKYVDKLELENSAAMRSRESLERTINQLIEKNKENAEALDIASHAIEILRSVSDETVGQAYKFLEQSLNSALERMFKNTVRKIEIKESIQRGQYPQLSVVLHVGKGKTRSLKNDSGHGIMQIVSLLSILCLIVITGSRRIVVMDEIISGLDVENRKIVNDIMWTFTEIGFQFIVSEHGFVPEGSKVYVLEMVGDVSGVKQSYIAKKGVYLQGRIDNPYDDIIEEDEDKELEDLINESIGEPTEMSGQTDEQTESMGEFQTGAVISI